LAENALFDALAVKICLAVFAVGDDKKKGKGRESKGREEKERKGFTKSQDVIFQLWPAGGQPGPIPTEFGMRVAPHDVIKMSNLCNKIFRGFRSTMVKISIFPLTAGHRYMCRL